MTPPLHLYLDADGCCHPDDVYREPGRRSRPGDPGRGLYFKFSNARFFERAPMLDEALRPFPDIRIVLSTTWVMELGFSFTVKQLPAGLAGRVVGATAHRRWHPREDWYANSRYNQIHVDVVRRRIDAWLALDDNDRGWPDDERHHLIATRSDVGLQPEDVDELVKRIRTIRQLGHVARFGKK